MKTLNTHHEYAKMITTRYITPRVQSLFDYQVILKAAKTDPLTSEAIYMYIIVTCHQLITFLGIDYTNGSLNDIDVLSDKHYLQIDLRNCGGKMLHVNELTNIQKSLLSEMLFYSKTHSLPRLYQLT